jgi:uncharacterized protein YjbJ (UPF0337 family)
MNWDQVQGQMKQIRGKIKQKWAKLTDDDLALLAGKKDEFLGRLQKHYGYEKDDAERELDDFLTDVDSTGKTTH